MRSVRAVRTWLVSRVVRCALSLSLSLCVVRIDSTESSEQPGFHHMPSSPPGGAGGGRASSFPRSLNGGSELEHLLDISSAALPTSHAPNGDRIVDFVDAAAITSAKLPDPPPLLSLLPFAANLIPRGDLGSVCVCRHVC
jgi:hypothetical protein